MSLDSRAATAAYYGGVLFVIAALFVTHLLPCVDYPQHLALADVARRLINPAAPEHREYQLNYFTYNGLFHFVVARLSLLVPIEVAGRLVVGASLFGTAAAVVALLRVLGRPTLYAALFTPILFSFSVGWGFVNFVFATAVALSALVFVARAAMRPNVHDALAIAVLGLVCAYAHVLAMLILCATAAALAIELGLRAALAERNASVSRRVRILAARAAWVGIPLLLGCAYCIAVNARQYKWDPNMYRDPTMEGSAPPVLEKLAFFGAFATDLYRDGTDQLFLWAGIAVMAWATYAAARARGKGTRAAEEQPPVVGVLVVGLVAYFATPSVVVGTHLIFQRLAQWVILGGVLATPRFSPAMEQRLRPWILRLGVAAGLNTVLHSAVYGYETSDASALIDDLPAGRAAAAVIWEPGTIVFRNSTLTHLAGYYAARKHGQWAFAFARYLSVPVRFREHSQPAWPERGWEFSAGDYDPRCKYARAFPLVIVKAPSAIPRDASGEGPVRLLVFKGDAAAVRLLSHHGRYWAFDTEGLPDDGKL